MTKKNAFQMEYDFNIRDYCKVVGIDYNSGTNYADIKDILKKLSDRSMWLDDGNGEVTVRWLAKARVNKKSGLARIEIDRDLAPYLFDLGQRFTQYQLHNILAMKSAFSVRIYELMKSYSFQKSKTFDIDELKHLLMVENVKSYSNYKDFRIYVLEKAQSEINELTDINIHIEPIFKGRKVVKVKFRIEEKNTMQRVISIAKTNEILIKNK
jgi:plasmid replication initiation protein